MRKGATLPHGPTRIADSFSDFEAVPSTGSPNPLTKGVCDGIYLATSGNVVIETYDGKSITFTTMPAGFNRVAAKAITTCPANTVACYA